MGNITSVNIQDYAVEVPSHDLPFVLAEKARVYEQKFKTAIAELKERKKRQEQTVIKEKLRIKLPTPNQFGASFAALTSRRRGDSTARLSPNDRSGGDLTARGTGSDGSTSSTDRDGKTPKLSPLRGGSGDDPPSPSATMTPRSVTRENSILEVTTPPRFNRERNRSLFFSPSDVPPSIVREGRTPVYMEDMYTPPLMNRERGKSVNTPQTGPNTEMTRKRAKSIANAFKKHDRSASIPNVPSLATPVLSLTPLNLAAIQRNTSIQQLGPPTERTLFDEEIDTYSYVDATEVDSESESGETASTSGSDESGSEYEETETETDIRIDEDYTIATPVAPASTEQKKQNRVSRAFGKLSVNLFTPRSTPTAEEKKNYRKSIDAIHNLNPIQHAELGDILNKMQATTTPQKQRNRMSIKLSGGIKAISKALDKGVDMAATNVEKGAKRLSRSMTKKKIKKKKEEPPPSIYRKYFRDDSEQLLGDYVTALRNLSRENIRDEIQLIDPNQEHTKSLVRMHLIRGDMIKAKDVLDYCDYLKLPPNFDSSAFPDEIAKFNMEYGDDPSKLEDLEQFLFILDNSKQRREQILKVMSSGIPQHMSDDFDTISRAALMKKWVQVILMNYKNAPKITDVQLFSIDEVVQISKAIENHYRIPSPLPPDDVLPPVEKKSLDPDVPQLYIDDNLSIALSIYAFHTTLREREQTITGLNTVQAVYRHLEPYNQYQCTRNAAHTLGNASLTAVLESDLHDRIQSTSHINSSIVSVSPRMMHEENRTNLYFIQEMMQAAICRNQLRTLLEYSQAICATVTGAVVYHDYLYEVTLIQQIEAVCRSQLSLVTFRDVQSIQSVFKTLNAVVEYNEQISKVTSTQSQLVSRQQSDLHKYYLENILVIQWKVQSTLLEHNLSQIPFIQSTIKSSIAVDSHQHLLETISQIQSSIRKSIVNDTDFSKHVLTIESRIRAELERNIYLVLYSSNVSIQSICVKELERSEYQSNYLLLLQLQAVSRCIIAQEKYNTEALQVSITRALVHDSYLDLLKKNVLLQGQVRMVQSDYNLLLSSLLILSATIRTSKVSFSDIICIQSLVRKQLIDYDYSNSNKIQAEIRKSNQYGDRMNSIQSISQIQSSIRHSVEISRLYSLYSAAEILNASCRVILDRCDWDNFMSTIHSSIRSSLISDSQSDIEQIIMLQSIIRTMTIGESNIDIVQSQIRRLLLQGWDTNVVNIEKQVRRAIEQDKFNNIVVSHSTIQSFILQSLVTGVMNHSDIIAASILRSTVEHSYFTSLNDVTQIQADIRTQHDLGLDLISVMNRVIRMSNVTKTIETLSFVISLQSVMHTGLVSLVSHLREIHILQSTIRCCFDQILSERDSIQYIQALIRSNQDHILDTAVEVIQSMVLMNNVSKDMMTDCMIIQCLCRTIIYQDSTYIQIEYTKTLQAQIRKTITTDQYDRVNVLPIEATCKMQHQREETSLLLELIYPIQSNIIGISAILPDDWYPIQSVIRSKSIYYPERDLLQLQAHTRHHLTKTVDHSAVTPIQTIIRSISCHDINWRDVDSIQSYLRTKLDTFSSNNSITMLQAVVLQQIGEELLLTRLSNCIQIQSQLRRVVDDRLLLSILQHCIQSLSIQGLLQNYINALSKLQANIRTTDDIVPLRDTIVVLQAIVRTDRTSSNTVFILQAQIRKNLHLSLNFDDNSAIQSIVSSSLIRETMNENIHSLVRIQNHSRLNEENEQLQISLIQAVVSGILEHSNYNVILHKLEFIQSVLRTVQPFDVMPVDIIHSCVQRNRHSLPIDQVLAIQSTSRTILSQLNIEQVLDLQTCIQSVVCQDLSWRDIDCIESCTRMSLQNNSNSDMLIAAIQTSISGQLELHLLLSRISHCVHIQSQLRRTVDDRSLVNILQICIHSLSEQHQFHNHLELLSKLQAYCRAIISIPSEESIIILQANVRTDRETNSNGIIILQAQIRKQLQHCIDLDDNSVIQSVVSSSLIRETMYRDIHDIVRIQSHTCLNEDVEQQIQIVSLQAIVSGILYLTNHRKQLYETLRLQSVLRLIELGSEMSIATIQSSIRQNKHSLSIDELVAIQAIGRTMLNELNAGKSISILQGWIRSESDQILWSDNMIHNLFIQNYQYQLYCSSFNKILIIQSIARSSLITKSDSILSQIVITRLQQQELVIKKDSADKIQAIGNSIITNNYSKQIESISTIQSTLRSLKSIDRTFIVNLQSCTRRNTCLLSLDSVVAVQSVTRSEQKDHSASILQLQTCVRSELSRQVYDTIYYLMKMYYQQQLYNASISRIQIIQATCRGGIRVDYDSNLSQIVTTSLQQLDLGRKQHSVESLQAFVRTNYPYSMVPLQSFIKTSIEQSTKQNAYHSIAVLSSIGHSICLPDKEENIECIQSVIRSSTNIQEYIDDIGMVHTVKRLFMKTFTPNDRAAVQMIQSVIRKKLNRLHINNILQTYIQMISIQYKHHKYLKVITTLQSSIRSANSTNPTPYAIVILQANCRAGIHVVSNAVVILQSQVRFIQHSTKYDNAAQSVVISALIREQTNRDMHSIICMQSFLQQNEVQMSQILLLQAALSGALNLMNKQLEEICMIQSEIASSGLINPGKAVEMVQSCIRTHTPAILDEVIGTQSVIRTSLIPKISSTVVVLQSWLLSGIKIENDNIISSAIRSSPESFSSNLYLIELIQAVSRSSMVITNDISTLSQIVCTRLCEQDLQLKKISTGTIQAWFRIARLENLNLLQSLIRTTNEQMDLITRVKSLAVLNRASQISSYRDNEKQIIRIQSLQDVIRASIINFEYMNDLLLVQTLARLLLNPLMPVEYNSIVTQTQSIIRKELLHLNFKEQIDLITDISSAASGSNEYNEMKCVTNDIHTLQSMFRSKIPKDTIIPMQCLSRAVLEYIRRNISHKSVTQVQALLLMNGVEDQRNNTILTLQSWVRAELGYEVEYDTTLQYLFKQVYQQLLHRHTISRIQNIQALVRSKLSNDDITLSQIILTKVQELDLQLQLQSATTIQSCCRLIYPSTVYTSQAIIRTAIEQQHVAQEYNSLDSLISSVRTSLYKEQSSSIIITQNTISSRSINQELAGDLVLLQMLKCLIQSFTSTTENNLIQKIQSVIRKEHEILKNQVALVTQLSFVIIGNMEHSRMNNIINNDLPVLQSTFRNFNLISTIPVQCTTRSTLHNIQRKHMSADVTLLQLLLSNKKENLDMNTIPSVIRTIEHMEELELDTSKLNGIASCVREANQFPLSVQDVNHIQAMCRTNWNNCGFEIMCIQNSIRSVLPQIMSDMNYGIIQSMIRRELSCCDMNNIPVIQACMNSQQQELEYLLESITRIQAVMKQEDISGMNLDIVNLEYTMSPLASLIRTLKDVKAFEDEVQSIQTIEAVCHRQDTEKIVNVSSVHTLQSKIQQSLEYMQYALLRSSVVVIQCIMPTDQYISTSASLQAVIRGTQIQEQVEQLRSIIHTVQVSTRDIHSILNIQSIIRKQYLLFNTEHNNAIVMIQSTCSRKLIVSEDRYSLLITSAMFTSASVAPVLFDDATVLSSIIRQRNVLQHVTVSEIQSVVRQRLMRIQLLGNLPLINALEATIREQTKPVLDYLIIQALIRGAVLSNEYTSPIETIQSVARSQTNNSVEAGIIRVQSQILKCQVQKHIPVNAIQSTICSTVLAAETLEKQNNVQKLQSVIVTAENYLKNSRIQQQLNILVSTCSTVIENCEYNIQQERLSNLSTVIQSRYSQFEPTSIPVVQTHIKTLDEQNTMNTMIFDCNTIQNIISNNKETTRVPSISEILILQSSIYTKQHELKDTSEIILLQSVCRPHDTISNIAFVPLQANILSRSSSINLDVFIHSLWRSKLCQEELVSRRITANCIGAIVKSKNIYLELENISQIQSHIRAIDQCIERVDLACIVSQVIEKKRFTDLHCMVQSMKQSIIKNNDIQSITSQQSHLRCDTHLNTIDISTIQSTIRTANEINYIPEVMNGIKSHIQLNSMLENINVVQAIIRRQTLHIDDSIEILSAQCCRRITPRFTTKDIRVLQSIIRSVTSIYNTSVSTSIISSNIMQQMNRISDKYLRKQTQTVQSIILKAECSSMIDQTMLDIIILQSIMRTTLPDVYSLKPLQATVRTLVLEQTSSSNLDILFASVQGCGVALDQLASLQSIQSTVQTTLQQLEVVKLESNLTWIQEWMRTDTMKACTEPVVCLQSAIRSRVTSVSVVPIQCSCCMINLSEECQELVDHWNIIIGKIQSQLGNIDFSSIHVLQSEIRKTLLITDSGDIKSLQSCVKSGNHEVRNAGIQIIQAFIKSRSIVLPENNLHSVASSLVVSRLFNEQKKLVGIVAAMIRSKFEKQLLRKRLDHCCLIQHIARIEKEPSIAEIQKIQSIIKTNIMASGNIVCIQSQVRKQLQIPNEKNIEIIQAIYHHQEIEFVPMLNTLKELFISRNSRREMEEACNILSTTAKQDTIQLDPKLTAVIRQSLVQKIYSIDQSLTRIFNTDTMLDHVVSIQSWIRTSNSSKMESEITIQQEIFLEGADSSPYIQVKSEVLDQLNQLNEQHFELLQELTTSSGRNNQDDVSIPEPIQESRLKKVLQTIAIMIPTIITVLTLMILLDWPSPTHFRFTPP
jgi:hypothetical protein